MLNHQKRVSVKFFVLDILRPLLSIPKLVTQGYDVKFDNSGGEIRDQRGAVVRFIRLNGIFAVKVTAMKKNLSSTLTRQMTRASLCCPVTAIAATPLEEKNRRLRTTSTTESTTRGATYHKGHGYDPPPQATKTLLKRAKSRND